MVVVTLCLFFMEEDVRIFHIQGRSKGSNTGIAASSALVSKNENKKLAVQYEYFARNTIYYQIKTVLLYLCIFKNNFGKCPERIHCKGGHYVPIHFFSYFTYFTSTGYVCK